MAEKPSPNAEIAAMLENLSTTQHEAEVSAFRLADHMEIVQFPCHRHGTAPAQLQFPLLAEATGPGPRPVSPPPSLVRRRLDRCAGL